MLLQSDRIAQIMISVTFWVLAVVCLETLYLFFFFSAFNPSTLRFAATGSSECVFRCFLSVIKGDKGAPQVQGFCSWAKVSEFSD